MSYSGLKYELCFLNFYRDNKDCIGDIGNSSIASEAISHVKHSFPYASWEELQIVHNKISRSISSGTNPGVTYNAIKEKFSDHLKNISSTCLYHFMADPNHLLLAIKNMSLRPTIINFEEYFDNNPNYMFADENEKEIFSKLSDDIDLMKTQIQNGVKPNEVLSNVKVPVFSCFTEMPEINLPFHAHHYGFWGISFKKEKLLSRGHNPRFQFGESVLVPVSYIDTRSTNIPTMIVKNVIDQKDVLYRNSYLVDLLKLKPMESFDFHPDHFYSVYFEREWRYISSKKAFEFKYDDIESIFVPKSIWEDATALSESLSRNGTIDPLLNFLHENNLKVTPIDDHHLKRPVSI